MEGLSAKSACFQQSRSNPYPGWADAFWRKYAVSGDPDPLWTRQVGSDEYVDSGAGLSTDGTGNVYFVGWTDEGDVAGPTAGGYDVFLGKDSECGTSIWMKQIGTTGNDYPGGISADGLGNVYIVGSTDGSLGGNNAGYSDAFVAKFDGAEGGSAWIRQFGTGSDDLAIGVSTDEYGNVYVSGYTYGDIGGVNAGGCDAFVAKYDEDGTRCWCTQFGTGVDDVATSVCADGVGNIYVAGYTVGSLGGQNAGGWDIFVAKFDDAEGGSAWVRQIGTDMTDVCGAGTTGCLSTDDQGNVYFCGYTNGSLGRLNAGNCDALVGRYDPSGNLTWLTQFGGPEDDWAESVSADGLGNVYVAGINFGGYGGDDDAFIAKLGVLHTLTVNSGSGDGQYVVGDIVDIEADAAPSGYMFDAWTGDTAGVADVNAAVTTLTMPAADATVTATYRLPYLTVNSGSGDGPYAASSVVNIQANAAPTACLKFWRWEGDTAGLASTTAASTTYTMPAGDVEITARYTYRGDLNCDGFVGQADLDIVLANWGKSVPPGNPLADPSGDNFVGQADLNIVLADWGKSAPPAGEGEGMMGGGQGMFAEEAFTEGLQCLDSLGQISLGISQVDGNEIIPGSTVYVTNVLTITTDSDWISGQIVVSPTGVSSPIYNPAGGAYAPYFSEINGYTDEEGQWVSGHPYYAYDSFVTAGMRTGLDPYYPEEPCYVYATPGANAADLTGSGGSAVWSTSAINQAWWTMYDDEEGERVVAQVTLKDTAQGTWSFRATASPADGPAVLATGTIVDGAMVPDE